MPKVVKPELFIVSLFFVVLGFGFSAKAWQTLVETEVPNVSFKDCFVSTGKYIFTKYLPGKLWVIMGKAGYIKNLYGASLVNLSSLSLFYQVTALIAASVISIGVVYSIDQKWFWVLSCGVALFVFFIFICHKPFADLSSKLLTFLLKKDIILPSVPKTTIVKVFFLSFFNWLAWVIAFNFMFLSVLEGGQFYLATGFIFPISSLAGILAIFAPGGLGVREGFLLVGLTYFNMPVKEATAVVILSRVWFLIGEAMFFLISIFLSMLSKNTHSM